MESATLEISLSLWEIRIEEMPCALNWSSRFRSASLSFSFRLAVGSSRIRSFTFLESALAISTSCCLPTPRLVTSVSGDSFRPTILSSSFVRRRPSDQSMTPYSRLLVAKEDVLRDRQERHQGEFLVDDDDAELLAVGDALEAALLALVIDLARIGAVRIDAAQNLHQRRLAGAVLADQRVDLAGT